MRIPHWSEGSFEKAKPLPAGEIHLWRFNLDTDTACQTDLLSSEELLRLYTIRRLVTARRYQNTRMYLRHILGSYLNRTPSSLAFIIAEGGKPELAQRPLQFNLSHSHDLGLLAITAHHPVGVDLEKTRTMKYAQSIARRMFPEEALKRMSQLDGKQYQQLFFEQWTAMEARQKALGQGIFESPVPADSMHCQHFMAADSFVAAVATESIHEKPALQFFNSPRTAYDAG